MKNNSPVILLKNVGKSYVMDHIEIKALSSMDLAIMKGEFLSVIGPSGSGKTTLLHILGCILRPSVGDYLLNNEKVWNYSHMKIASIRNHTIGFVFQNFNLMPRMNALDNVMVPLYYGRIPFFERRSLAMMALEQVGLKKRVTHFPNQLSGGEQQRVAIARALVLNPDIILADEPTGNLDSKTGEEILYLIKNLHDTGRTVIIVTHDELIADAADRKIHLMDGIQVNNA
ncbi:ABC transporter ATP-binding protein [Chlamydiota bacterium]